MKSSARTRIEPRSNADWGYDEADMFLSRSPSPDQDVRDVVFIRRTHNKLGPRRRGRGPGGLRDGSGRGAFGSRGASEAGFDLDHVDPADIEMNELDENGWAHIHHASFRGFVKSVDRFIHADREQLEMETGDDLRSTPLLLAVMSGSLDTVKCLVDLGARINVINTQNHGIVELCAFKQFIEVLEYFTELSRDELPVWKNLIRFLSSDSDEEAEAAAKCLRTLTQGSAEGPNPNCKPAFDNGVVPTIARVIKGSLGDDAKAATLELLLNLVAKLEVKEQITSAGGIPATIKLLKSSTNFLIQLAAKTIKEISRDTKYAGLAAQDGAIPALLNVIKAVRDPEVLVEVVDALGNVVEASASHQQQVGSQPGAIQSLVSVFENQVNKPLLLAMTRCIAKLVNVHEANQNAFVGESVAAHIITLTRVKNKELQLGAVAAIHALAENNLRSQKAILEDGVVMPLMQLLKKPRQQAVQEKTAAALWALAGDDLEERRNMASLMGVQLLIEFLSSLSEDLHYIGSEAMGVLAQGPLNKQSAIAQANGMHPLVRLLRSDKEYIVLSVIRTLRYLCVGVGYVPHPKSQAMIAHSRGIKFLVALMVHSRNELIQVESAHTLGCVALNHGDNMQELMENMDFSFVRILKMLYASQPMVRLLAGASLAAFAYNSIHNQRDIDEQGGVRFSCFVPFLESEDEFYRCHAAFQVVVLARIIPDEEQAISSAAGIKLLVDLLQDSKSDSILALTADCISRLAHTRAGVPAAFVSINSVNHLCDLLLSGAEQVRGCAAVALGYLSYNCQAQRQLLNRCRCDPYLMKILRFYTNKGKLSSEFVEGWRHYRQIGLPPIEEGRPCLVGRKNVKYKEIGGRPLTITTVDDTGGSTNLHHSTNNIYQSNPTLHDMEDKSNFSGGRSSRGSRGSLTPRHSHLSLGGSHRSRQNSMMSNELTPEIMD